MKNIHILPTDKPSRLYYHNDDKLRFISDNVLFTTNQNIYITSDEEIKEGDYFYQSFDSIVHKCYKLSGNYVIAEKPSDYPKNICKKIILTTDQDLIKDGVQAIDDEFLQWIVKNPSCEEVEIQKVYNDYGETDIFDLVCTPHSFNYQIIIPKEEPKYSVKKEYVDDQDAYGYDVIVKEKSKKETLSNPIIIVRNDDKEEFIHLSNGMYRTKWGILNNSVSTIPLEAFDKSKFTFYYE